MISTTGDGYYEGCIVEIEKQTLFKIRKTFCISVPVILDLHHPCRLGCKRLYASTIVNMLQQNRPFADIVLILILLQLFLMFQPIYENIFNIFCKNKVFPYIDAKLKYDVYEKAIQTDYKYIDAPDYYDNYSWAVGNTVYVN